MAFLRRGRARSTLAVRGGAPRRQTVWFEFQPVATTQTTTAQVIIFSLNAAALALRPFTVVRTLFEVHVRSDQAASGEDQVGAVGCAVVSDQAVGVGATAVPGPITELGSDLWFWLKLYMISGSTVNDGIVGKDWLVESRAMRKVAQGQDIVVVSEISSISSGLEMTVGGRMLVKLH